MEKSVLKNKRVGSKVNFLYPKHGNTNILRSVQGVIDSKGEGPNGPYVTVNEDSTGFRTFSTKKIVEL